METVELYRSGQILAVFEADQRPVEIGRALGCDIVVDDPELAERHFLVTRRRGALVAYDVSRGRWGQAQVVPLGKPWPLGREYVLLRRSAATAAVNDGADADQTAALAEQLPPAATQVRLLQVGHGTGARYCRLGVRPLSIGREGDNDVVLQDGAVSARHCRLEPAAQGLVVRDLGSRNGTFVSGVRVDRAQLSAGSSLRVGRTDLRVLERETRPGDRLPVVIAKSSAMMGVLSEARRLAQLRFPVLILGETGVGKEGIALTIHTFSRRSKAPFVTLNAGGIARELVESELFGHERGAFTGAVGQHLGVFEQADGGTLFLDEVGELPLSVQARLLRVLENGEVRRLGSEHTRRVDVRLVCATHRNLRAMVAEGTFRQDLYYRVARLVIELPPLRARTVDIPALSTHFLEEIAVELGPRRLTIEAERKLRTYAWPGNVRELRNVLTFAAAQSAGSDIDVRAVSDSLSRVGCVGRPDPDGQLILNTLAAYHGNVSATARALRIPRSSLRDKLRILREEAGRGDDGQ